jgi:hypothetical protein
LEVALAVFFAVVALAGLCSAIEWFREGISRSKPNVRELVWVTLAYNFGIIVQRCGGWNEREAMEALRWLIAWEANVRLETVTPGARFPECLWS